MPFGVKQLAQVVADGLPEVFECFREFVVRTVYAAILNDVLHKKQTAVQNVLLEVLREEARLFERRTNPLVYLNAEPQGLLL
jgi:hypothetical protein